MVFTQNVHPICLPVESNENAEKWKDEEVLVLGFASNDNTYGSLKKAEMSVHTKNKCNDKNEITKKCKMKGRIQDFFYQGQIPCCICPYRV